MAVQIIDRKTIGIPGQIGTVTPEVQQLRDEALAAEAGAQAARDEAEALSATTMVLQQDAVRTVVQTPGTGQSALKTAISDRVVHPMERLLSALDMRAMRPLVVAAAGDSTTSPFATGAFERAWKDCAAELWPERPFSLYRWSKESNAYGAEVIWQDAAIITDPGGTNPDVVLLSDAFAGPSAEMNGRAPEIGGSTWGGSTGAYLSSGGALIANPEYTSGGIPSMTAQTLETRADKAFRFAAQWRMSMQESGSRQRRLRMNVAGTTEIRLQVIGSTSASTCEIVKIIAGTSTTLATFSGAIPANAGPTWYDVAVSLTYNAGAGNWTLTATLNGVTVNATLTNADVAGMGNSFGLADQSLNGGLRGRDGGPFSVIGNTTREPVEGGPSPYPKATVYNASVAGSTLAWQVEHIEAMFPAQPDVVFIHHGHNYWGDALSDTAFVDKYVEFLDLLFTRWAPCPVVVSSQNPEFAPKEIAQITEHQSHMVALRLAARSRSWGYVPIYEAFAARSDGGKSYVQADGIHPVIGFGTNLQTAVLKQYVRALSARASV